MAIDHSLTYRKRSLRNTVHRHRLKTLQSYLSNLITEKPSVYFDVGCSNGYLTNVISEAIQPEKSVGLDHSAENVSNANNTYENISFDVIDLNTPVGDHYKAQANVITCLETLEHVGDVSMAVGNLRAMLAADGTLMITVPIETGPVGLVKFLLKTLVYRYDLSELGLNTAGKRFHYFLDLLLNKRIDGYREPRDGWGSHFGFDYRLVQSLCEEHFTQVQSNRRGTTRFIRCTGAR